MTLLFDGKQAFFAERGASFAKDLVIRLPTDEFLLLFNGKRYYPRARTVCLPKSALRFGKNELILRKDNRLFPCEGLIHDGESICPCGLSADVVLVRQHELLCAQEAIIAALGARVEALEAATKARTLFA